MGVESKRRRSRPGPAARAPAGPAAGGASSPRSRCRGWGVLVVGVVLAAMSAGCRDTAEDLAGYLFGPGGMEAVLAEEARVIEEFNERVNEQADSEERAGAVAGLLGERILPAYSAVLGRMSRVQVENKKVLRLHQAYLEITRRQKQVFEELLGLLEAEEYGALTRVNLHLAKLRNRRTDWEGELRRLCEKYEVTRGEQ